jgi:DNA-binding NtrC family response regulator
VLRNYVDQDSINYQKESGALRQSLRDRVVSKGYLETLNEATAARNQRTVDAIDAINHMPTDTIMELKRKAATCLAFFGIEQRKIYELLNISRKTLYNIFRGKHGSE